MRSPRPDGQRHLGGAFDCGGTVDDLVEWLGQQLDEDERIARAVRVPPNWHQGPGDDPDEAEALGMTAAARRMRREEGR